MAKQRALSFLLILIFTIQSCSSLPRINDQRPNFLIIVTDDQRFDTMQYMPYTQQLIFDQGVTFSHGYVTTPYCCPSRASILTGMYAHNHYVHLNEDKLKFRTVVDDLHNNGYYTGLVGKYLNSWSDNPRPEFDYWVSFWGGTPKRYYDPRLNINGVRGKRVGYITYLLRDRVLEFLDKASQQSKPFLLFFTPNAPHDPFTPANEDLGLYLDIPKYRPPNFNEADVSDKTHFIQNRPPLTEDDITGTDALRLAQIQTLASLDRSISEIMKKLKQIGELDNTVIIFISDNGLHWGEHRLNSKSSAYEESVKVPFAMRYPRLIPKPYTDGRLVANIDIAPTIYELSETPIPDTVDGLSLTKLFSKDTTWRTHLLLEAWPDRGHWTEIHTDQYVYIETDNDLSEFYDLKADPYQLDNRTDQPEYQSIVQELKKILDKEQEPRIPPPEK